MLHVILGGTGTLGRHLVSLLCEDKCNRIRVVARGEHRLAALREQFPHNNISYIIGDVRDPNKILDLLDDSDETYVYLLAALKHVHSCEYSVIEAVRTNIDGAVNVVNACRRVKNVRKCLLISTDKAVEPITTYGITKAMAERIFVWGNYYTPNTTEFLVARYGNVLSSQGSVLENWRRQLQNNQPLTLSDANYTRFWCRPEQAAQFVQMAMTHGRAGDILIPVMSSLSLGELKHLVAPDAPIRRVEPYFIEKPHELLLAPHELGRATYNPTHNFIRVSYVNPLPVNELPWLGGQMSSLNCINTDYIATLLKDCHEFSHHEVGFTELCAGAQRHPAELAHQS
ncbi:MAG: polysaccharide biosynthesis protein [Gorillibacterium sp.]|nr:polysaccharide biosynthesis protein [Gorillibacterium sp.]